MKTKVLASLLLTLAFAASWPAYAHHGYAAYDMSKTITLTGNVTEFTLANPHSTLAFDVKDAKGDVDHWSMEFGYIRILRQAGWTFDTLKAGDQITVTFHPAKNGAHIGALSKVMTADGRDLPLTPDAKAREARSGGDQ